MANYLFIIGAMKAGTTTLFDYLKEHPDFCPAIVKEPEFFSERMTHGVKVSNYDDLFPDYSGQKYKFEASTGYTRFPYDKGAPEKISKLNGNKKFIYILRDPYSRIESHQNFMSRYINYSTGYDSDEVLLTSDYYLQLKQYMQYFESSDFLLLDFDELKQSPQVTIDKVVNFLDIAPFTLKVNEQHSNKTLYLTTAERALKRIKGFSRIRKYIPEKLSVKVKGILNKTSERHIFKLDLNKRKIVHSRLQSNMKKLKDEFHVNVSRWGF